VEKIICIADTHFPLDIESQSLFPRQMKRISKTKARQRYERLTAGIAQANTLVNNLLNECHPDYLFHLGDVTGGWKEKGVSGQLASNTAKYHARTWRQLCPNIHFCLGGHDTGYSHRGSLSEGGINAESVQNCRNIFGDLWWLKECEDVYLLGICSPLANYHDDDGTLEALQNQQSNFLHEANSRINGKPWILFAHDPFLPPIVSRLLQNQLPNCRAFIHGHRHNPKFTKLLRTLGSITKNKLLQVSHTCPSVAPLWWRGCGMMKITVDGEKVTIKNRLLDVPPEIANLPTASFFRCLMWMLRPR